MNFRVQDPTTTGRLFLLQLKRKLSILDIRCSSFLQSPTPLSDTPLLLMGLTPGDRRILRPYTKSIASVHIPYQLISIHGLPLPTWTSQARLTLVTQQREQTRSRKMHLTPKSSGTP